MFRAVRPGPLRGCVDHPYLQLRTKKDKQLNLIKLKAFKERL